MPLAYLEDLYRAGDDPWNFRTSPYEQAKFAATRGVLSRTRYASALEIGCGNGSLAAHLSPLCDSYVGLDGVETALASARRAVPAARFVQGYFPCALPAGPHDLIVLSEFLYFLDPDTIADLARRVADEGPEAEIVVVTYLGDTGHALQGAEALAFFLAAMPSDRPFVPMRETEHYRIDCRPLPEPQR